MPLEKRSATDETAAKRKPWGSRRCTATGSHGPCHLMAGFDTYCEWHAYIIRYRGARGVTLDEFDEWRDVRIYRIGDRRWLMNTPQEWWEAVSGVAALPATKCDTCGAELIQGTTLVDWPDDRGKFCIDCWPGPTHPKLAKREKYLEERRAERRRLDRRPRGTAASGMTRAAEVATQHHEPPPPEEDA